jgi:hypothetical protein
VRRVDQSLSAGAGSVGSPISSMSRIGGGVGMGAATGAGSSRGWLRSLHATSARITHATFIPKR